MSWTVLIKRTNGRNNLTVHSLHVSPIFYSQCRDSVPVRLHTHRPKRPSSERALLGVKHPLFAHHEYPELPYNEKSTAEQTAAHPKQCKTDAVSRRRKFRLYTTVYQYRIPFFSNSKLRRHALNAPHFGQNGSASFSCRMHTPCDTDNQTTGSTHTSRWCHDKCRSSYTWQNQPY